MSVLTVCLWVPIFKQFYMLFDENISILLAINVSSLKEFHTHS